MSGDLDGGVPLADALAPRPTTVSALASLLAELGIGEAFGVSGGAMAALWDALSRSSIEVRHFRHETGAAFAAIECGFATDRAVAVFTTTGPGLGNALTGMLAARDDGARIVLVSAHSSAAQRGRLPIQETTPETLPLGLFSSGAPFDFACVLDDPAQLGTVAARLSAGLARPDGFVAHLALPSAVQNAPAPALPPLQRPPPPGIAAEETVEACARRLRGGRCAVWVGFGARHAAEEVRELVRRLDAVVLSTPRAKGVFPERDPRHVGVSGIGGHEATAVALETFAPAHTLVLGTRLGEASTFHDPRLAPGESFIHVDIDPAVPAVAYPATPTLAVCAEIGTFLRALLARLPATPEAHGRAPRTLPARTVLAPDASPRDVRAPVRPTVLMQAVQARVVDGSSAPLLAECGNSFIWTTHFLRFDEPGRYRVSTGVGSMGHAAAGVVGAALARGGKAVAVVGDGAMLMNNEISTAVQHGAEALWIVLNDARYNMCAQGMETLGLEADASMPETDFALFARAQGAHGLRAAHEHELHAALDEAMATRGPCLLDVRIDPERRPPSDNRNRGLQRQIAFPARS